jgi:arylsulfatase
MNTMKTTLQLVALAMGSGAAVAADALDRTVLPIPEPTRPAYTELDVRKTQAPPRFEVKAPAGAPNVVIILIDDLGFGGSSTFGGPIPTPALDKLAKT